MKPAGSARGGARGSLPEPSTQSRSDAPVGRVRRTRPPYAPAVRARRHLVLAAPPAPFPETPASAVLAAAANEAAFGFLVTFPFSLSREPSSRK